MRIKNSQLKVIVLLILLGSIFIFRDVFNFSNNIQLEIVQNLIDNYIEQFQRNFLTKAINQFDKTKKESIIPRCQNHTKLVIVSHSSPKDHKSRHAIRLTWGQWTLSSRFYKVNKDISHSNRTELFFLLGQNKHVNKFDFYNLYRETQTFHDIIYHPDLYDTYYNLSYKTMAMLRWADQYCPSAKFLLKADMDIFLNIPLMVKLLNEKKLVILPFLGGGLLHRAPVIRDRSNKWYLSKYEYVNDFFPHYVEGPGYIISKPAIKILARYFKLHQSYKRNIFKFEDVFMGILAKKLKINIFHIKNFLRQDFDISLKCLIFAYVIIHKINYVNLVRIWFELVSTNNDCFKNTKCEFQNFFNSVDIFYFDIL